MIRSNTLLSARDGGFCLILVDEMVGFQVHLSEAIRISWSAI